VHPMPPCLQPGEGIQINILPPFVKHMEVMFDTINGDKLFSGALKPRVQAWIRTRLPVTVDAGYLAALMDCCPPSLLAYLPESLGSTSTPHSLSLASLTTTIHLTCNPRELSGSHPWFLHSGTATYIGDGITDYVCQLWHQDGTFVGTIVQQIFGSFRAETIREAHNHPMAVAKL